MATERVIDITVEELKALIAEVVEQQLTAQATLIEADGDMVVIATTNVGHLARFVDAREWQVVE